MKIVRIDPGKREPATGALFVGTAARQAVIGEGDSGQLRIGVVTFQDGAVNKFHRHTFDQVLVVTEGEGIVQVKGDDGGTLLTHQDAYNSDSFISVPLVYGDRLSGVLNLSNKRGGVAFTEVDLDRATLVGSVLAMIQGGREQSRRTPVPS